LLKYFYFIFDSSGARNICTLATINKIPRILVASADGYLYIYNVDPAEGQECTLLRQFPLIPNDENALPSNQESERFSAGLAVSAQRTPSPQQQQSASSSPLKNNMAPPLSPDSLPPLEQNLKLSDDSEYPPLNVRNE